MQDFNEPDIGMDWNKLVDDGDAPAPT